MDIKELNELAESNRVIIDYELSILDYGYCMKLRELYKNYKKGLITSNSYQTAKNELGREYRDVGSGIDGSELDTAKMNLGRRVRLVLPVQGVDSKDYILNAIIVRTDKDNKRTYSAELQDISFTGSSGTVITEFKNVRWLEEES